MEIKELIKSKIDIFEKIKDDVAIFTNEFTLASGAATALKDLLEEIEKGEN